MNTYYVSCILYHLFPKLRSVLRSIKKGTPTQIIKAAKRAKGRRESIDEYCCWSQVSLIKKASVV